MNPMMQLVVGWTLVGGFVFTMTVTCLSLLGLVKFADPRQQRALFASLVLQLLVGMGGRVAGALRFDAREVGRDVHETGTLDGGLQVALELLAAVPADDAPSVQRETVIRALEALNLSAGTRAAVERGELVAELRAAPDRADVTDILRAGSQQRRLALPRN